jgi:hypothetical protein
MENVENHCSPHSWSVGKGKGKVVPALFFLVEYHAMEAYWGNGGIERLILYIGTRWRRVGSFMSRLIYRQGNSPWYPLDRRLGGPQSRSGHGGEEKNSHSLSGREPPIIQPVAQHCTTDLEN